MALDKKNKKDFFGKTVADAIQAACRQMDVPQEELAIEVIETGSSGVFGLISKKAHIRVAIKEITDTSLEEKAAPDRERQEQKSSPGRKKSVPKKVVRQEPEKTTEVPAVTEEQVSEENLELVKNMLDQFLAHMGFPSTFDMTSEGLSIHCQIESEFEPELTGPDGKTLDSLQYLLRKMIARKIPDRLRLTIDVGDFRQRRLDDLKERAKELAEKVIVDGKTRVIPALNPSERRVVHMELQNEKGVKSRSVGDGLFKKVLVYKPGKKRRPSGNRRKRSHSPRGKSGKGKQSSENSDNK